jgi:hypothetical protein
MSAHSTAFKFTYLVRANSADRSRDRENQTAIERIRHNTRTLPEDRPSASNSVVTLPEATTPTSATVTPTAATANPTSNASNSNTGPLPAGWGM